MRLSGLKAAFDYFKKRKELDKIYKACIEFKDNSDHILCSLADKYNIDKGIAPIHLFYFSIFLIRDLYLNNGNNTTKLIDDKSGDKLLLTEMYVLNTFCGDYYDYEKIQDIYSQYHMAHVFDDSTKSFNNAIIKMFNNGCTGFNETEELLFAEPLSNLANTFQDTIKTLLI